jgi:hypothetical protein
MRQILSAILLALLVIGCRSSGQPRGGHANWITAMSESEVLHFHDENAVTSTNVSVIPDVSKAKAIAALRLVTIRPIDERKAADLLGAEVTPATGRLFLVRGVRRAGAEGSFCYDYHKGWLKISFLGMGSGNSALEMAPVIVRLPSCPKRTFAVSYSLL